MFFMYTLMHASLKFTLKVKMSLFGIKNKRYATAGTIESKGLSITVNYHFKYVSFLGDQFFGHYIAIALFNINIYSDFFLFLDQFG